jgi:hypothetical protein
MARLRDAAEQLRNAGEVHPGVSSIPNVPKVQKPNMADIPTISNIPVRILRGFFSGVGQLLLAADRFREVGTQRERYGQDERFDPPAGLDGEPPPYDGRRTDGDARRGAPGPGRRAAGRHSPATGSRVSGARRVARPRGARRGQHAKPPRFRSLDATGNVRILTPDMPAETAGAARPRAAGGPSRKTTARSTSATRADLPVPGYDGLSLPSIRARLRGLDTAQLRLLCEHEKSGANRADVVTMLERRIAKLEAAARDAT